MYRRIVFLSLGVLECLTATIVVVFAWGMPGADEVHDGVGRIESVTEQMSGQLARLRAELQTIREQRPKLRTLAENLRTQMEAATAGLKDRAVDYVSVERLESSMGDLANGLDGLADAFKPDAVPGKWPAASGGRRPARHLLPPRCGADCAPIARLLRPGQKGLKRRRRPTGPRCAETLTGSARLLRAVERAHPERPGSPRRIRKGRSIRWSFSLECTRRPFR